MDIVDFFKQQVERWNTDSKCGFCWTFSAPIRVSDLNEQQTTQEEACCVHVFITNLRFRKERGYNPVTTLITSEACNWTFDINIVRKDDVGKNVYNEIPGHLISESKWETILKPIHDCITCDDILEFCAILGYNVQITEWAGDSRIDWLDDNYTGWVIRTNFRVPE